MPKYLFFLLLFIPLSSFAQFTISGRILNYDDKKPVANADVFLNNATAGTNSDSKGDFKISNVKPGKYFIIVSIVGYTDFSEQVQVSNGDIRLDDIYITPSNKTLKEVVIKPKEIPSEYMYVFKEEFLGKSEIAHDCKILNPEILDISFNRLDSSYTASSNGYLIIENPDLGYRIKYELQDFYFMSNIDSPVIRYHGHVHFEQMPGNESDMRRWEARRQEAYENSSMHFLKALISDRLDEEGFKVQQYITYENPDRPVDSIIKKKIQHYKDLLTEDLGPIRDTLKFWQRALKEPHWLHELRNYPLEQRDLISRTDQPNLFAFGCDGDKLLVTYNADKHFDKNIKLEHLRNPKNTECTLIGFNIPYAFIDRYGSLVNPYNVGYMGVWANMRVADLLPVDYEAPGESSGGMIDHVDSTVSKKVTVKLNDYNANHVTEKVYLHFDRPYYAAGDTMFFKAYVATGDNHQPSTLSSVLHVDLIDGKGKINKSITLGISDAIAWGDLVLPDTLAGGNYQVRAYTEWMRNEGTDSFFDRIVPVSAVSGIKNGLGQATVVKVTTSKPEIQFFPESGNWVPGIKTKMAFKAISPNGFGIDVKGSVSDKMGNVAGFFISDHKGMGCFYINGEVGKAYTATVTYGNGYQETVNLPPFSDKGITMAVNNDSPDKVAVKIVSGKEYLKANNGKDYTLVAYSGGKVVSIICKLDQAEVPVELYKNEFRSGIARITLFAPSGEPLCERLVFIQNFDELKLKVNPDKPGYTTKDKVTLTLNALDEDSAPVSGHFSVSVTDEHKLPVNADDEHTILTDMLLTSELKGYVEQPNYYFNNPTPEVLNNLDVLMLTQGYRSFEWKQVLDNNKPLIKYPAETSLSLSGTMKTLGGKPIEGGTVTLLSTKRRIAMDTTTDSNGNFKFTGLYITDTARLVLHGHMKNNSDKVKLTIDHPDIPAPAKLNDPDTGRMTITDEMAADMKKRYEQSGSMKTGILLKQVDINRKTTPSFKPELTHSANLNGPGNADQVIMGDQLGNCPSLRDCLMAMIHGVQYNAGVFYSVRTHIELLGGTRQPMVFIIDGVVSPQTTGDAGHGGVGADDRLDEIAPEDIYSIEVLVSQSYLSIYGSAASAGAIVITTRHGGEFAVVKADGSVYYNFHGFEKSRTFYSPKYDVNTPVSTHPDQRTTIYWQPEVTTDGSGNASFEFFNAADPGTYRVVVEGMDAKGNIGRDVFHYTVK